MTFFKLAVILFLLGVLVGWLRHKSNRAAQVLAITLVLGSAAALFVSLCLLLWRTMP